MRALGIFFEMALNDEPETEAQLKTTGNYFRMLQGKDNDKSWYGYDNRRDGYEISYKTQMSFLEIAFPLFKSLQKQHNAITWKSKSTKIIWCTIAPYWIQRKEKAPKDMNEKEPLQIFKNNQTHQMCHLKSSFSIRDELVP
jgi:hypothetical protein